MYRTTFEKDIPLIHRGDIIFNVEDNKYIAVNPKYSLTAERLTKEYRDQVCPECLGNGYTIFTYDRPGGIPGYRQEPCETCHGLGKIEEEER